MFQNDKHLLMFSTALCIIFFSPKNVHQKCTLLFIFYILVECRGFLFGLLFLLSRTTSLLNQFFLTECTFEHKTNSHAKKLTIVEISFRCLTCKLDEEGH